MHPWSSRREMFYLALLDHASQSPGLLTNIENPLDYLPLLEQELAAHLSQSSTTPALHDSPGSSPSLDSLIQWSRFARDAARVLYLAAHGRQHIESFLSLGAMQAAIDDWSEQHLDDADLIANVRRALALRTEHKDKIVIPRPEKASSAEKPGN